MFFLYLDIYGCIVLSILKAKVVTLEVPLSRGIEAPSWALLIKSIFKLHQLKKKFAAKIFFMSKTT